MDCLLAQAALVVTLSVRLLGIELAVERDGRIHDLVGPVTTLAGAHRRHRRLRLPGHPRSQFVSIWNPIQSQRWEWWWSPTGRPLPRQVTGIFFDFPEFSKKWLELLKEAMPQLSSVAVLWDPASGPM
jgi:hypothetical protein